MKKGDVILITFPFTNLKGSKLRPAVVLYDTRSDVTVCFISTKITHTEPADFLIHPGIQNGLKKLSLVKTGKIATLNKELAMGLLGQLNTSDLQHLNKMLKMLFNF